MERAGADNLRNSIENQNYLRFISKINCQAFKHTVTDRSN